MNITNTLFKTNLTENNIVGTTKSTNSSQYGFSFESHLSQKTDQMRTDTNGNKTEDRPKAEKVSDQNQAEKTVSKENKTENKSSTTKQTEKKELETKIVEELAEKLDISVEEVMEILASLQITVLDLIKPEALHEFVAELMAVEDTGLLLLNEDVAESLTAIQDVLNEFASELEFAAQMEDLPEEIFVPVEQAQKTESKDTDAVKQTEVLTEEEVVLDSDNMPKVEITVEQKSESKYARHQQNQEDANNQDKNLFAPEETDFLEQPLENIAFHTQNEILEVLNEKVTQATTTYLDQDNVVNQVIERIKVDIRHDVSEIKLMLKPDNLGQVSIKVISENGLITAQIIAENQRVKEILESNFNQLKNAMQEQGLNISELNVSVSQQDSGNSFETEDNHQGRSKRVQNILDDFVNDEPVEENENPYLASDNQVDYFA